ncbi:MAG: MBL fold metallo-hydrolase [bacterium]
MKRLHKPALNIEQLPPIDILLLSHAHMDHLHPYSCEKIVKHSGGKTQVVVAPGVKRWLARWVQKQTTELDRGQVLSIDGVTVKACEVNHR